MFPNGVRSRAPGQIQEHPRPVPSAFPRALPPELSAVAIIPCNPFHDVAQSLPALANRETSRKSRAIVRYLDAQEFAFEYRPHTDCSHTFQGRNSVLDRVLDQRLDGHGGNWNPGGGTVHAKLHAQTFAESSLLHSQIRGHEFDLFVEANPLVLGPSQRIPEYVCQLLDGFVRQPRLFFDQAGDCVERIEEEVWIHLRAQRFQFGTARQPPELLLALAKANVFKHHSERAREGMQKTSVVAQEGHAVGARLDSQGAGSGTLAEGSDQFDGVSARKSARVTRVTRIEPESSRSLKNILNAGGGPRAEIVFGGRDLHVPDEPLLGVRV
jgi:hypothetical protein